MLAIWPLSSSPVLSNKDPAKAEILGMTLANDAYFAYGRLIMVKVAEM